MLVALVVGGWVVIGVGSGVFPSAPIEMFP